MGKLQQNVGWTLLLLFLDGTICAPNNLNNNDVSSGESVLVISSTTTTSTVRATTVTTVTPTPLPENNVNVTTVGSFSPFAGKPRSETEQKNTRPEIYSFRIFSDIKYRYSTTYVTSRVANRDESKSHEVTFRVILPETAFISSFLMEIDGKSYKAFVKEKEEAKRVYSEAQSQGHSAGLVEVSTRNSNTFNVNVNIAAQSKVTFNLTYEELLTRRLGKYEQTINISPEQVKAVKDFKVEVKIEESQNITYLKVPNLRNDIETEADAEGNNKDAIIVRSGNKANVSWSPSLQEQEKLAKQGKGGKFVVQYDINRESTSGEVLVMEGYFVHFFAPENLQPLKKHVVFILDISGSMWGRKMEQLKESQKKILDDLNAEDFFNIITFSSDVFLWSPSDPITKSPNSEWTPPYFGIQVKGENEGKQQPFPATPENIKIAKEFIDSLIPNGGTNIHDSLMTAINLTTTIRRERDGLPPTIEAETNATEIPEVDLPGSKNVEKIGTTNSPSEIQSLKTISSKNILPKNVESLIIFLTDGEPTVGISEPSLIQQLIQAANKNSSIPIFSLGFGEGADFPFLRKLSLQNYGFARKIYEASDATLQLKGFYNEIASPLLSNVKFNYTSPEYNVTDVTIHTFSTIFGGTEIAIAGKLVPLANTSAAEVVETTIATTLVPEDVVVEDETTTTSPVDSSPVAPEEGSLLVRSKTQFLNVAIEGSGRDGHVGLDAPPIFCHPIDSDILRPFPPRPTPPLSQEDRFLDRLWAYLTIQQLIEKDLTEDSKENEIMMTRTTASPNSEPEAEGVTKLSMNLTSKPETPKQKAIRLALQYGFVTPFTSLVVVKPNNSDVANAVPSTDSDTTDSFPAPQSLQSAPAFQPLALKIGNFNQRIVSYSPPGLLSAQPLSLAHRGPVYSKRPARPASASFGYHPSLATSTRFGHPSTTATSSLLSGSSYEEDSWEDNSYQPEAATTVSSPGMELEEIGWLNISNPILEINGTKYTVVLNETSTSLIDDQGYECNASGQCVHLRDCVQHANNTTFEDFETTLFCPIQETGSENRYVGICCPSSSSEGTTTATPALFP